MHSLFVNIFTSKKLNHFDKYSNGNINKYVKKYVDFNYYLSRFNCLARACDINPPLADDELYFLAN